MTDLADAITTAVRAGPRGDVSQLGTVAVISGTLLTITVAAGSVAQVRRLTSYTPVVGDRVVLIRMDSGDWYVPGKLA